VNLLLDTNVLSEVRRPEPDRRAIDWLDRLDEDHAYISVIPIAEIRRGISLLEASRRRDSLAAWMELDLPLRFEGRMLAVDREIALAWGDLMASAKRLGCGLTPLDGLIGATALARGLTLATRNIKDFKAFDIELVDPWST
jgi:toxin FitB